MLYYFNIWHILILLIPVALCTIGIFLVRLKRTKVKLIYLWVLWGISLGSYIIYKISLIITLGNVNFWLYIPLSVASLNLIFMPLSLYKRDKEWYTYFYFVTSVISLFSMIFFNSYLLGQNVISFAVLFYFIMQSTQLCFALSLKAFEWVNENKMSILKSVMTLFTIVMSAHIINVILRFTAWAPYCNFCVTMGENNNIFLSLFYYICPIPLIYMVFLLIILVGVDFAMLIPKFLNHSNAMKKITEEQLLELKNLKSADLINRKLIGESYHKIDNESRKKMDKRFNTDKDKFI